MNDKIIVKTYIHLKDNKRWEKLIECGGDYICEEYMERLMPDPYNFGELIPDDHKYKCVKENLEHIWESYYFKHIYFTEV